jgi:hypothetical protein
MAKKGDKPKGNDVKISADNTPQHKRYAMGMAIPQGKGEKKSPK